MAHIISKPQTHYYTGRQCTNNSNCNIVDRIEIEPDEPIMYERYCTYCGYIRVRMTAEERKAQLSREGWVPF